MFFRLADEALGRSLGDSTVSPPALSSTQPLVQVLQECHTVPVPLALQVSGADPLLVLIKDRTVVRPLFALLLDIFFPY